MWGKSKLDEDKLMLLDHGRRIGDLESFQINCDSRHSAQASEGRRLSDKIDASLQYQQSMENTVKSIERILLENIPTVQRTKNNFIAIDTLKSWAIWIAAIGGGISAIIAVIHIIY